MTRKEMMELLLAKVPEAQKEAFVAALREAKGKDAMMETLREYNIQLAEEEINAMRPAEVSDEELDNASGGCDCWDGTLPDD